MSDTDPATLVTFSGALFGAGGFATWAMRLWAQVRREATEAAKLASEAQRADNARMVDALTAQASSNTALLEQNRATTAALATLGSKLDALADRFDEMRIELDDIERHKRSYNGSRSSVHDEHDH